MDEIPVSGPDPNVVLSVTAERNCDESEFSGEFYYPESSDLGTFLKVQLYLFAVFCYKRQHSNLGSFVQTRKLWLRAGSCLERQCTRITG
jgi:hypothetical protein